MLFRDSIVVSSGEPGEFVADVITDLPEGLETQAIETIEDSFEGCGWLVGGNGRCDVDERHEPIDVDGRCVPFFRGFKGRGRFFVAQDRSTRCVLADAWDVSDGAGLTQRGWTVQNMSRLRSLDSCFGDGSARVAEIASHLNAATWVSPIPPDNRGVLLRKIYDRFHGRQRARVKIDGAPAGIWYEAGEDRERRWAVSEFGVPAALTAGKSAIEITIDPPPGTALWSVSRFEVWALAPAH